jgi:hypothetical protein
MQKEKSENDTLQKDDELSKVAPEDDAYREQYLKALKHENDINLPTLLSSPEGNDQDGEDFDEDFASSLPSQGRPKRLKN